MLWHCFGLRRFCGDWSPHSIWRCLAVRRYDERLVAKPSFALAVRRLRRAIVWTLASMDHYTMHSLCRSLHEMHQTVLGLMYI
jgi:hypothetical protein